MAGMASADTLSADGDVLVNSPNISIDTEAECDALPHTYTGATTPRGGQRPLQRRGDCDGVLGPRRAADTAGITVGGTSTWTVTGWNGNPDTHDFPTSVSVPAEIADGPYKVNITASGAGTNNQGTINPYVVTGQVNVSVSCDQFDDVTPPANQAPVVEAGGPYSGAEGGHRAERRELHRLRRAGFACADRRLVDRLRERHAWRLHAGQ